MAEALSPAMLDAYEAAARQLGGPGSGDVLRLLAEIRRLRAQAVAYEDRISDLEALVPLARFCIERTCTIDPDT